MKEARTEDVIVTGKETILLVDDEATIIGVVKEMLETLGYQVLTAVSGREVLEVYERNKSKINLVVLDMIMPEMGGGETFDRLKDINPEIKVILASVYSLNGEASGIIAGAVRVLFKCRRGLPNCHRESGTRWGKQLKTLISILHFLHSLFVISIPFSGLQAEEGLLYEF